MQPFRPSSIGTSPGALKPLLLGGGGRRGKVFLFYDCMFFKFLCCPPAKTADTPRGISRFSAQGNCGASSLMLLQAQGGTCDKPQQSTDPNVCPPGSLARWLGGSHAPLHTTKEELRLHFSSGQLAGCPQESTREHVPAHLLPPLNICAPFPKRGHPMTKTGSPFHSGTQCCDAPPGQHQLH